MPYLPGLHDRGGEDLLREHCWVLITEGLSAKREDNRQMNIIDLRGTLPQAGEYARRSKAVTAMILHHSATESARSPEAIARYHVDSRGYPGIAYHYLVYADGTVYQCHDDDRVTWHAGCAAVHGPDCPLNANSYALGVCLVGDFTHAAPPPAQLEAARELYGLKCAEYGALEIYGHRSAHGAATACPGDAFTDEMIASLAATAEDQATTDARWHAEHSVRLMEAQIAALQASIDTLQEARQQLVDVTIPRLYELEGVTRE